MYTILSTIFHVISDILGRFVLLCSAIRKFLAETGVFELFKNGKIFGLKFMELTLTKLRQIIIEELTADDKAEIKRMATKEAEKVIKTKDLKNMIAKEVEKSLSGKTTKDQIGDITKSVLKKLYKDLSLQHPYIIDRIKI
jgi:hypothetical protein